MLEKVGKVTVDLSCYSGNDLYSDGPIEDEMYEISKDFESKDINKIIDDKKEWPILYHYSFQRENIVNWLPIKSTDKVLEVGSGCGAITGALCRKAKSVTSIELSKKRTSINANRHKEADNLVIHVGNFLDIEPKLDNDYDYICLIGVFEYGQSYMGTEKPFHKFLEIIKKHVKTQGRIVIAIENKLGLKYFAGCREDHLGTYFSGIESYPQGGYVRTFSKNGLEKIFKECQVEEYHFYYPYPDYKFPTTIFSDKRLPIKGELTNNLRNFDRERLLLFDEKNAFDGLIEDGLFPIFSNSFLVILGPDVNLDFIRYSNERKNDYQICTVMKNDENGNRKIYKYPERIEAINHILNMKKTYEKLCEKYQGSDLAICPVVVNENIEIPIAEFEFIPGRTLSEILDEKVRQNDMEGFTKLLLEFKEKIGYNSEYPFDDIDLVFSNVIVNEDKWTVIDYEWTKDACTDPKRQTYRALYCYLQENESRQKLDLSSCYKALGVDSSFIEKYNTEEFEFHKNVQGMYFSLAQLREEIGCGVVHPEKYLEENAKGEFAQRVQIYTDRGNGYNEQDSYFVKKADFSNGTIEFDIEFDDEIKNLRIDPMMSAGVIYIDTIEINGVKIEDFGKKIIECNGRKLRGERLGYVFDTSDPNMNLHIDNIRSNVRITGQNKLHAKFGYVYMSDEAAHGILTAIKKLV